MNGTENGGLKLNEEYPKKIVNVEDKGFYIGRTSLNRPVFIKGVMEDGVLKNCNVSQIGTSKRVILFKGIEREGV